MAAMGRIRSPNSFFFFKPPHFPRNKTAFAWIALSKSIIVAALALPIPKLIMVIPLAVALGIGASNPFTSTLFSSANILTYLLKFVSKIYLPNLSNGVPVYLGNQFATISSLLFIERKIH
jgi:hypothetical protein